MDDLERELRYIPQTELYRFIDLRMSELCRLVKPGHNVEVFQEGYFCSNCNYKLNNEETWWHYCPNCLVIFDCCEEENEPCEICGSEVERLVLESYKKISQKR
ncbi:hypothetical protein DRJ17_00130 [Candidatus Woesearchaeota archaeon]|nr:MAG: hypothetical protein DRJ17_00130 [Candidatus Woesearchaeota archaeon]